MFRSKTFENILSELWPRIISVKNVRWYDAKTRIFVKFVNENKNVKFTIGYKFQS